MGVFIISDGVGKPFSVRLAADDDLYVQTPELSVSILSNGVGKPFSVLPAAVDDLMCSFSFFKKSKHIILEARYL